MENNSLVKTVLADIEQQLEGQLKLLIADFQQLNEQQLNYKSAPDNWSIAQCLWHLNSYGNFYLPQINKAVQVPDSTGVTFKSGWLGSYFAKIMHPQTTKSKYKAFKNHIPPELLNGRDELSEFIHQQETLLVLVRKSAHANLNKRLPISISPFIKLKLGDVFSFMVAHIERHIQQAVDIKNKS